MVAKIKEWKDCFFSASGKERLIKSVLQAIPTYTMSCFKILTGICRKLSKNIMHFWWAGRKEENMICWLKWDQLCRNKKHGGLGFGELQVFNLALLSKQGWRLAVEDGGLLSRIYKGNYFSEASFLEARVRKSSIWAWKSMCSCREVLKRGLRWRVVTGDSVNDIC